MFQIFSMKATTSYILRNSIFSNIKIKWKDILNFKCTNNNFKEAEGTLQVKVNIIIIHIRSVHHLNKIFNNSGIQFKMGT